MADPARLSEVQADVLRVLDREANTDELRDAARRLGSILIETADDDGLWERLSGASAAVQPHDPRVAAALATEVDWAEVLAGLGARPADEDVAAFATALRGAPARRERDVDSIRTGVRGLGRRLVVLSRMPAVSSARLRRWLRGGARVAGTLAIVVGLAAASVALGPVLVTLVAPALAHVPAANFVAAVLVEIALGIALDQLGSRLEGALPDHDELPSEHPAAACLDGVSEDAFAELRGHWALLADGTRDRAALISKTDALVEPAIDAVNVARDALACAKGGGADRPERFDALDQELADLHARLHQPGAPAPAIARALGDVTDALASVQTQVRDELAPQDPLDELEARIDAQSARVERLETQVRAANHLDQHLRTELTQARLKPKAWAAPSPAGAERPEPTPAAIDALQSQIATLEAAVAATGESLQDLRGFLDEAKRRLTELEDVNA